MQTLKECFSHEPTEKSVFKKKKLQKKKKKLQTTRISAEA